MPTSEVGYSQRARPTDRRSDPRRPSRGQHVAELVAAARRRRAASNGVGSALRITRRAPARSAMLGQRRRRVDAERRARARGTRRRRRAARCARSRSSGTRFSPKRDRRRLQHAAALEARRVVLAGAHPVERLLHRAAPAARQALRLVHVAVDLDDRCSGDDARGVVQPVDVLGDERVQRWRARSSSASARWPALGSAPPHLARRPVLPRPRRMLGVGDVVLERRASSRRRGSWSTCPCGPRKSGMPDSVEMPAPVSTTICSASRNHARDLVELDRCRCPSSRRYRASGDVPRGCERSPRRASAGRGRGPGRVDSPSRARSAGWGLGADRLPARLRGGGRTPSPRSRGTMRGGTHAWNSACSTWSGSSPCSSSVNATRRARRRAVASGGSASRRLGPFGVRDLQVGGQPAHVATVDRRDVAAHGDRVGAVSRTRGRTARAGSGCARSASWCRSADRGPSACDVSETVSSMPPGCGRSGRRGGAGAGAQWARGSGARTSRRSASAGRSQGVDDRVGPGLDGERGGHGTPPDTTAEIGRGVPGKWRRCVGIGAGRRIVQECTEKVRNGSSPSVRCRTSVTKNPHAT